MSSAFWDIVECVEAMNGEELDEETIDEFAAIFEEICGEPVDR